MNEIYTVNCTMYSLHSTVNTFLSKSQSNKTFKNFFRPRNLDDETLK